MAKKRVLDKSKITKAILGKIKYLEAADVLKIYYYTNEVHKAMLKKLERDE